MPEPIFKLAIENTVVQAPICLENLPTSSMRFVLFEFTLVRFLAFLVSFDVVSDLAIAMLHIM